MVSALSQHVKDALHVLFFLPFAVRDENTANISPLFFPFSFLQSRQEYWAKTKQIFFSMITLRLNLK